MLYHRLNGSRHCVEKQILNKGIKLSFTLLYIVMNIRVSCDDNQCIHSQIVKQIYLGIMGLRKDVSTTCIM